MVFRGLPVHVGRDWNEGVGVQGVGVYELRSRVREYEPRLCMCPEDVGSCGKTGVGVRLEGEGVLRK